MGLFAVVLAERLSLRLGLALLGPLMLLGASSVAYWWCTESHGRGDLRPYYFVQFYPLVAVPLLLALFPPRYTRSGEFLIALAWYLLAKVTEIYDGAIFHAVGVSGYTIKSSELDSTERASNRSRTMPGCTLIFDKLEVRVPEIVRHA